MKERILAGIVILFLVAGCVSVRPRPADWPDDRPLADGHELEGRFLDQDSGLRVGLFLTRFALPSDLPVCDVALLPDRRIEFRWSGAGGRLESLVLPYEIQDGWLVAARRQGINQEGVLAAESVTLALRVDATGALVVRVTERLVGMMLLVPGVTKDERWYRLPRAPRESSAPASGLAAGRDFLSRWGGS